MSELKEILDRIKTAKQKKKNLGNMQNQYLREAQFRQVNNMIAFYEKRLQEFGGGKNIYRMNYRFSNEPGVADSEMIEYYQADNTDEAKAACLLHNIDKVGIRIASCLEIILRNPTYL